MQRLIRLNETLIRVYKDFKVAFFNIKDFNTYACAYFLHFYQHILGTHMLSTHQQCEIPQFRHTRTYK